MSNTLILNQSQVLCGLGTMTYTIPTGGAGLYNVSVQCQETPPSSLTIVVNKNGSPVFTAPVESVTQSAFQFKTTFLVADADVITVVLASGAAVDNLLNSIKTSIAIANGVF